MKITKIERQKKQQNRYSIYLNEQYAFGVEEDTLIRFNLFKGTELEEADIEAIKQEDYRQKAYKIAVRFLSHRLRSIDEVKKKLSQEEIEPEAIQYAIERLKQQGYLNDQFYADSYTKTTMLVTKRGPKQVERELKSKGVNAETIEQSLEEYSLKQQVDNASQLGQKYVNRMRQLSPKIAKQKVQIHLLQKGFSAEVVEGAISLLNFSRLEDGEWLSLLHHGEKLFQRYERKFSGYELEQKVKEALYQKGFSQDAICQFIEERGRVDEE